MVAGATGLVGREVLAVLSADRHTRTIHVVGRRAPTGLPSQAGVRFEVHTVDFAQLPALPAVDDVYIALGTTIAVAGSEQAFRAVDHDAVLALARAARLAGARRLAVVSAMGANRRSRVFYDRVKGETEAALGALGYETLVIARPSLLIGHRDALGQPARRGESLGQWVMAALRPVIPANYRAITARDVATAMVRAMTAGAAGTQVLLSGAMQP
ncbi:MAG: NAD(P)H-binding protein [Burkholderiaceae bacterium]